jgi:magnesium transporter
MIKSKFYLTQKGELVTEFDAAQIPEMLSSGEGLLWVDIEENTTEDGEFLSKVFPFHHLAVADCVSKNIHPPKIDEFDDHLFIIIHGINYYVESEIEETTELALFIGKNYVVTSHDVPLRSIESTVKSVQTMGGRLMRRGADMLAYEILDALVDNIMPTIEELQETLSKIETEALQDPKKDTLSRVMQVKKSILALNRVMSPQREMVNNLSRGLYPFVSDGAQIYYRNVYDHLVRIESLSQDLRDLADSILATYLSSVSNRMNQVMKVLSIVAAIFLPLALIAGIYGMNFVNMPELQWRFGYFVIIGVMAALAGGLAGYFRKKKWF